MASETPVPYRDAASEIDFSKTDILAGENVDPVLNAKMRLINNVFQPRAVELRR
jgi:hypothetical protein